MISQNKVGSIVTVQNIRAHVQVVPTRRTTFINRWNRQSPARKLDIDSGIPVDVIQPILPVYFVITRAASQMISRLATVDHVIADATINHDTLRRSGSINGVGS